jgi:hypothetical protein
MRIALKKIEDDALKLPARSRVRLAERLNYEPRRDRQRRKPNENGSST